MPRRKVAPPLDAAILADDHELLQAAQQVIDDQPKLQKFTEAVKARLDELRHLLNEEQWKSYMALEEATTQRTIGENLALIRWAASHATSETRRSKPLRTPMALGSDGSILLNALMLTSSDDLQAAVDAALQRGGQLFIGICVRGDKVREALHLLDDAAAEIAARVGVSR